MRDVATSFTSKMTENCVSRKIEVDFGMYTSFAAKMTENCVSRKIEVDFGMFEVPKVTLKEWARMR